MTPPAGTPSVSEHSRSQRGCGASAARSAQHVAHAIPPEVQYIRLYSYGIQRVILLLPCISHYMSQYEKCILCISLNSHSDSESQTESARDGGSNASKRLKTAAAEPVCEQKLQLLGLSSCRSLADADRCAVCGQPMAGSAPDLHFGTLFPHHSLAQSLARTSVSPLSTVTALC